MKYLYDANFVIATKSRRASRLLISGHQSSRLLRPERRPREGSIKQKEQMNKDSHSAPHAGNEPDSAAGTLFPLSPNQVAALLSEHFATAKDTVGPFEIIDCGNGHATLRMPYHERFARPGGTISGPTMFNLADLGSYVAILADQGEAAIDAVTTTLTINFLTRPPPADLLCEVEVLRRGRRQTVCDIRIISSATGDAVAQASAIYVLPTPQS